MKILVVHNFYQKVGGEDMVFEAETELLRDNGHQVTTFTAHNNDLDMQARVRMAAQTIWNQQMATRLARQVEEQGVDVVHIHNTFPIISPSIYQAVRRAGAATVQTLHNYRLMCANGLLYRDGAVCEACVGHLPLPGVVHRCYRESVGASATVAAMQMLHRAVGTYGREVDAFIALTSFAKGKFIEAGLPGELIHVKPNFLPRDPGIGAGDGGYALFVGRLTAEKGIPTLLRAWQTLGHEMPLKILGDGPLALDVIRAAATTPGVEYLGHRSRDEVLDFGQRAAVLVLSSEWFEGGLPLTVLEAYASGVPVIAADIGAAQHQIMDAETGFHFVPGDSDSLIGAVRTFGRADQQMLRHNARQAYERLYTRERNYEMLVQVYESALARRHATTVR